MKRIITLLLMIAVSLQMAAQHPGDNFRPIWVGVDMGGTWQTSDMKAQAGIGWSVHLSRYSRVSNPFPLYWGWRFRFMDGRNYGYNYHSLAVNSNPVLSSGATNYASGSSLANGYTFNNYRMHFDEFAYELIVGSNGLRKHGVLLYGFGGIGLTMWKTKIDQLDGTDGMYDYSTITGNGNDDQVYDQLLGMWDGEYETFANNGKFQAGFMPNAGFGMGYQWGNAVAIGFEHRTTWARNDNIDGINYDYLGAKTPNDQYHYDGIFVRWTFGGDSRHEQIVYNDQNNNPPAPDYNKPPQQNPNVGTNPNPIPDSNPDNNNNNNTQNTPPAYPPMVRFTTPSVEPYTANTPNQQLVVRVDNVQYSSQITLTINNVQSNNFSFNPNTNQMTFAHTLVAGTNTYKVTATNGAGTASDVQNIIYKPGDGTPPNNPAPPQVTITNPASDPYNSSVASMSVSATVLNVTSASGIQVRRNNQPITNFTFDPRSNVVIFTANLQNGANLYEVIGTNSVGSASDAVTINYNPAPSIQPPVVTITNPATCPYQVKAANFTVKANITNVTAANQVAVLFNNQVVSNFTFQAFGNGGGGASISFPVTLNPGNNNISITGTNAAGSNNKTCVITYKVTTQVVPPDVDITRPNTNPATANAQTMTLEANVFNVNSQSEITVTFNNATVTNFTYNMNTHVLTYPATFVNGSNVFTVTATNANGTDSESTTINWYILVPPPTVVITTPSSNPHNTYNAQETVIAQTTNVQYASQVTVVDGNNNPVQFQFNLNQSAVRFTANLNLGNNPYTVTVTNQSGTASDNTVIKRLEDSNAGSSGSAGRPGSTPGSTSGSTVGSSSGQSSSSSTSGGRPGSTQGSTSGSTVGSSSGQSSSSSTSGGRPNSNGPTPPGNTDPQNVTVALVTPSSPNTNSTTPTTTVTMQVNGVAGVSEITARVNNVVVTNTSYNANTKMFTFTASLNQGSNTIQVRAQNNNGTASQTIVISYANQRTSGESSGSGSSTESSSGSSSSKPRETSSSSSSSSSSGNATESSASKPKTESSSSGNASSGGSASKPKENTKSSSSSSSSSTSSSKSSSSSSSGGSRGGSSSSSGTTTTRPR
jgi:large repetitive protein